MTMDKLDIVKQQIAELTRQLEVATSQAQDLIEESKSETIAKIVAMMQESGITLKDLKGQDLPKAARGTNKKSASETVSNKPKKIVAPKYRDAATETTWTGRGAKPKVFASMTPEELQACLIDKESDNKTKKK